MATSVVLVDCTRFGKVESLCNSNLHSKANTLCLIGNMCSSSYAKVDAMLTVIVAVVGGILVYCGVKLIGPIVYPTVIPYPWPKSSLYKLDKKLTVVLAGSFNPPHNGHLAMLHYLSERYVYRISSPISLLPPHPCYTVESCI